MNDPSFTWRFISRKQRLSFISWLWLRLNVLDHVNQFRALVTKTGEMFDESRTDWVVSWWFGQQRLQGV